MNFIKHETTNCIFKSPPSLKDVADLPVTRCEFLGYPALKTYWLPNEEDISNILAGGHVCLYVMGTSMSPVTIAVEP